MIARGRAWALALVSASMVACAHGAGTTVAVAPEPPGPNDPPTREVIDRWDRAAAIFTRLDAAGTWDGEACQAALSAFEEVNTASGGRSARAVYMAGLISVRCSNDAGAQALYRRALELDPSLCEARVGLGAAELSAGRGEAARQAFEEAVRRDNQCAPAYVNLAILQGEIPEQREAALANLRRALAVRADYLPALDRMALIYLAQAEERPELLELAEVVCRQAQLIDPDYASLYNTWGLIDVEQGELTSAAAKFARAMELDDRSFEAHMNFGQITLSQRAYDDAARAFARARELSPSSYDAALGLGVASRGLRDPERAEAMYRAALALDAARPEAYFDLAVLYQEHREGSAGELRQALDFLRQFVERARGADRFASTLREVTRWCAEPRRARRAPACASGRAQNIVTALGILDPEQAPARPDWTR